jgi:hypothetical protein
MQEPLFELNQVYEPTIDIEEFRSGVRTVAHNSEVMLLMPITESGSKAGLLRITYSRWLELLSGKFIVQAKDPYAWVPSEPAASIPEASRLRLMAFHEVLEAFSKNEKILFSPYDLSIFFERQVIYLKEAALRRPQSPAPSKDSLKRWFYAWLRAGKKPLAVIAAVIREKPKKTQQLGARRGRVNPSIPTEILLPGYKLADIFQRAYDEYIKRKGLTVEEAMRAALKNIIKIPEKDLAILYSDSTVARKYQFFSEDQFRRAMARLRKSDHEPNKEVSTGRRGRATDGIYGPGYYEIDSTHFQIQLVSRLGGRNLVSRPTVYLVTDVFSGAIVGYVLTLENCSWAMAMMALFNSFADKAPTFKRLGLPYESEDWPCHHLPVMLRADRAEFITNRGQNFPDSLIRVEITSPYEPKRKGTVEGKHSEAKRRGRSLPGAYAKRLERGESDGKNHAAYDLEKFERRLVEIIMELNRRPLARERIPLESIAANEQVGNRIELWYWGLVNRPGFTVKPDQNFLYEHLLAQGVAKLTSRGIKFENQIYRCDLLLELGWLQSAPSEGTAIRIAYNLLFAGEIHFKSTDGTWHAAQNLDVDVIVSKASFAELKELSTVQRARISQASVNAYVAKEKSAPRLQKDLLDAKEKTKEMRAIGGASKSNIRQTRDAERKLDRGPLIAGSDINEKPAPSIRPPQPTGNPQHDKPRRSALDFWDDEL